MKRLSVVLVLFLFTWVAWAQGDTDVVTVALSGNVETMDPHVASSRAVPFLENIYEPLVGLMDESTELSPVLAESFDVSEDQTIYTFNLRSDITFHDGTPLDAEAVKLSFERVQAIQKGPYWAISYLEDVEVVDPLTVRMTIRPGGPPFLQAASMVSIMSPTLITENEVDGDWAQEWAALNTSGTGPYILDELIRGDRFVLSKFDDYWRGWEDPHFSRAVMLLIPERSTAQLMLEQGEIDIAEQVPTEAIPNLREDPEITVVETDSGVRVLYLMLNSSAGPTADPRVRKAISYAFDTQAFLDATGGAFTSSDGPVPREFLNGYRPEIPYMSLNLDRTQELLEEAGQTDFTLDVYYTTGDQTQELAGQILQAYLGQIGIEVNVIAQDFPALLRAVAAWDGSERSPDDPNFRMANFLYTPPRMPDAYAYLWYMYHSMAQGGRGRNLNFYENPEVDRLIDEGALATNSELRQQRYREAVDVIVEDAPQVFIGTARKVYTMRSDIGGFYIHPTWYPAVRVYPLFRQLTD